MYIPNHNALIIYLEDIGLKLSADHDQDGCNDMLNMTVVCVCVSDC